MADTPEAERLLDEFGELRRTVNQISELIDRLEDALKNGAGQDVLAQTVTEMRFFADGARTLAERALRRV